MDSNTPEIFCDEPKEGSFRFSVNESLREVLDAKFRLQMELDEDDAELINPYTVYEVCEAYMTHPAARHFRLGRSVVRNIAEEPESEEEFVCLKQAYRSELDIYVSANEIFQLGIETTSIHPKKKWMPAIALLGRIAFVEDSADEYPPETKVRLQPPERCYVSFDPNKSKPRMTKLMADRIIRLPHIAQAQFPSSGDKADQQR